MEKVLEKDMYGYNPSSLTLFDWEIYGSVLRTVLYVSFFGSFFQKDFVVTLFISGFLYSILMIQSAFSGRVKLSTILFLGYLSIAFLLGGILFGPFIGRSPELLFSILF